jgi:hypothetical protein
MKEKPISRVPGSKPERVKFPSRSVAVERVVLLTKTEQNGDEYVEEISNPQTGYYQKKVVRQGPGFSSVTIVSSSSGGPGGAAAAA